MPIEVRIDVVPYGIESLRQHVGTVRIVQIEILDDELDGWRVYDVVGIHRSRVKHKRSDGARVLVAKALTADLER